MHTRHSEADRERVQLLFLLDTMSLGLFEKSADGLLALDNPTNDNHLQQTTADVLSLELRQFLAPCYSVYSAFFFHPW